MRKELGFTRELAPWFRGFDDLFSEFFRNSLPANLNKEYAELANWNPSCDIEETETHYLMAFDLPGVKKEDIKIDLNENTLTVSGERKYENKSDVKGRHVWERSYGKFQRAFTMPSGVDFEKAEANYDSGVLRIAVPKAAGMKTRSIKIGESTAIRDEKH